MKKFFKDEMRIAQKLTLEAAKQIFKLPDDIIEKGCLDTEKFIIIHCYMDDNYSVQIALNLSPSYQNNSYLVMIFNKENDLLVYFSYPSHIAHPPVWNREFGDIDYLDFLGIQKEINKYLHQGNMPVMDYDLDPKGKSFYMTKENPTEILKLLEEGKSYQIIGVFADKKLDWVDAAKQMMGFN